MPKINKFYFDNEEKGDAVRINRFLSDAGVCSRREADDYIINGEVQIDGEKAELGSVVVPGQEVTFKGKVLSRELKLNLIAFNKPFGIVCTTDRREPNNIIDYIQYESRIYPIGRLDKDSNGLILLTNDGTIVNKILRAGNHHEKEYVVEVNKAITHEFLKGMSTGVPILDTVTKPCFIEAINRTSFRIILTQGLNRQIRRMCEYFDYKVISLTRTRIMNIELGRLKTGGYRNLTEKELEELSSLIENSTELPEDSEEAVKYSKKANYKALSKGYSGRKKQKIKNMIEKKSEPTKNIIKAAYKNEWSSEMDDRKSSSKSGQRRGKDDRRPRYRSDNDKEKSSKRYSSRIESDREEGYKKPTVKGEWNNKDGRKYGSRTESDRVEGHKKPAQKNEWNKEKDNRKSNPIRKWDKDKSSKKYGSRIESDREEGYKKPSSRNEWSKERNDRESNSISERDIDRVGIKPITKGEWKRDRDDRKPDAKREWKRDRDDKKPDAKREWKRDRDDKKPDSKREWDSEKSNRRTDSRREWDSEKSNRKPDSKREWDSEKSNRKPDSRREWDGEKSNRRPDSRREWDSEKSNRRPDSRREWDGEKSNRRPDSRREWDSDKSNRKPDSRREWDKERGDRKPDSKREWNSDKNYKKPDSRSEWSKERGDKKSGPKKEWNGEKSYRSKSRSEFGIEKDDNRVPKKNINRYGGKTDMNNGKSAEYKGNKNNKDNKNKSSGYKGSADMSKAKGNNNVRKSTTYTRTGRNSK